MATFGDYVQSVTQDKIVPAVVDGILNGNVLAHRFLGNGMEWSGEALKKPLKYQKNTSGGSYSGFDTLSTTQVNTRTIMSFDPRQHYHSVVLSNLDLAVNSTSTKVLDLLQVEMESTMQDMLDDIGTSFYSDGTGNSNKQFLGLAAAVDDASVVATYGNLARATYGTAMNASVTTSVGALSLSAMATSYDAAQIGGESPTLLVSTPAVWSDYEALLQPTVRATYDTQAYPQVTKGGSTTNKGALRGEIGFDSLIYRGTPFVKDEKCTSGYLYMLNEKHLMWYGLKHPQHGEVSVKMKNVETNALDDVTPAKGLAWSGLKEPVNQDAEIGHFFLYGNLVCWSPRRQAVMQGIT